MTDTTVKFTQHHTGDDWGEIVRLCRQSEVTGRGLFTEVYKGTGDEEFPYEGSVYIEGV